MSAARVSIPGLYNIIMIDRFVRFVRPISAARGFVLEPSRCTHPAVGWHIA